MGNSYSICAANAIAGISSFVSEIDLTFYQCMRQIRRPHVHSTGEIILIVCCIVRTKNTVQYNGCRDRVRGSIAI
jgi:hypothetical protein